MCIRDRAKTHYASLLDSGVRISEWLPGFVHAKVFVVDDCEAVVGTINLDYRKMCIRDRATAATHPAS